MNVIQSITEPFGISVFGSSIIRVEPDIASLHFAVSRLEQHPRDAFREARDGAQAVRAYLDQHEIEEVSSSRVTLTQSFRYSGSEQVFVGYLARVAFHVLMRDMERVEEVLIGVVDAGANEIRSTRFHTSRLKEIRAEARRRAVSAAREKAEIYCDAAGVTLGPVVHVEDVNPDLLRLRGMHEGREQDMRADDEGPIRAFDPGSITVEGAVMVAFALGES
jgi:uncharacterized protein YggE